MVERHRQLSSWDLGSIAYPLRSCYRSVSDATARPAFVETVRVHQETRDVKWCWAGPGAEVMRFCTDVIVCTNAVETTEAGGDFKSNARGVNDLCINLSSTPRGSSGLS